ncbi:MAG: helix-hairpin-helix domain-containing protein [Bacteroidales bacterium]|nr:helix-hairpin-helix domain-containing protein [Bacteroidales bacterium]
MLQVSTLRVPGPSGRDDALIPSIIHITGADSEEELEEGEIERFLHLSAHPLSINRASRSRLLSSGLFTPYQVATILDYRQRTGDILSIAELSVIHGFGRETAAALAPFIVLESSGPPASVRGYGGRKHDVSEEVTSKLSVRFNKSDGSGNGMKISEGLKYHLEVDGQWEFNLGLNDSSERQKESWKNGGMGHSMSLAYSSPWRGAKISLNRLVVGDFNLRFGQGLAMWSGMGLAGLSNVGSFSRNPTGLNPYRSYSAGVVDFSGPLYRQGETAQRGLGAELGFGRFALTASLSLQQYSRGGTFVSDFGLLPVLNLSYYGRIHQESLTSYLSTGFDGQVRDARLSADFRVGINGVDVFGESAIDLLALREMERAVAFLAGTRFKAGEIMTLAAMLRYYPAGYSAGWSGAARSSSRCTDEHGASLAARLKAGEYRGYQPAHLLDLSLDGAWYPSKEHLQIKALANYTWSITENWNMAVRLQYRHRNYDQRNRLELRLDGAWKNDDWQARLRLHGVYGNAFGGMAYVEGAYTGVHRPELAIYLRAGLFHTEGWADRIYVYERDAPGNFNVPALYGDGWWSSFYLSLKLSRLMKLGLRFSTTRLDKYDGRLQLSFLF